MSIFDISEFFKPSIEIFTLPAWMRRRFRKVDKSSAISISRSKYKPHQGERECTRRLAKLQKGGQ